MEIQERGMKRSRTKRPKVRKPSHRRGPLEAEGAARFTEVLTRVNDGVDPRCYFMCTFPGCYFYGIKPNSVGRHFTLAHEPCNVKNADGGECGHKYTNLADIQNHYKNSHPGIKKSTKHRGTYRCFECFYHLLKNPGPQDKALPDRDAHLRILGNIPEWRARSIAPNNPCCNRRPSATKRSAPPKYKPNANALPVNATATGNPKRKFKRPRMDDTVGEEAGPSSAVKMAQPKAIAGQSSPSNIPDASAVILSELAELKSIINSSFFTVNCKLDELLHVLKSMKQENGKEPMDERVEQRDKNREDLNQGGALGMFEQGDAMGVFEQRGFEVTVAEQGDLGIASVEQAAGEMQETHNIGIEEIKLEKCENSIYQPYLTLVDTETPGPDSAKFESTSEGEAYDANQSQHQSSSVSVAAYGDHDMSRDDSEIYLVEMLG